MGIFQFFKKNLQYNYWVSVYPVYICSSLLWIIGASSFKWFCICHCWDTKGLTRMWPVFIGNVHTGRLEVLVTQGDILALLKAQHGWLALCPIPQLVVELPLLLFKISLSAGSPVPVFCYAHCPCFQLPWVWISFSFWNP